MRTEEGDPLDPGQTDDLTGPFLRARIESRLPQGMVAGRIEMILEVSEIFQKGERRLGQRSHLTLNPRAAFFRLLLSITNVVAFYVEKHRKEGVLRETVAMVEVGERPRVDNRLIQGGITAGWNANTAQQA